MKKFIIFSLLTSLSAGLVTYFKDQPDQSANSELPKSRSAQLNDIISLKPAKNAQASYTHQFSVAESQQQTPAVVDDPPDLEEILPQVRHAPPATAPEQPANPENTLQTDTVVTTLKPTKQKTKVREPAKLEQLKYAIPAGDLRTSLADLEAIAKQDPRAAFDLGLRYFRGDGVRQDSYQALQWMRDAAERGDIDAQKAVGRLYMTGLEEMGADFQEAEKWLTIAAGRGDREAAALLLEASDAKRNESEYRISTYRYWHSRYPYRLYWREGSWNYY